MDDPIIGEFVWGDGAYKETGQAFAFARCSMRDGRVYAVVIDLWWGEVPIMGSEKGTMRFEATVKAKRAFACRLAKWWVEGQESDGVKGEPWDG